MKFERTIYTGETYVITIEKLKKVFLVKIDDGRSVDEKIHSRYSMKTLCKMWDININDIK